MSKVVFIGPDPTFPEIIGREKESEWEGDIVARFRTADRSLRGCVFYKDGRFGGYTYDEETDSVFLEGASAHEEPKDFEGLASLMKCLWGEFNLEAQTTIAQPSASNSVH